jgi:hypothetical protein
MWGKIARAKLIGWHHMKSADLWKAKAPNAELQTIDVKSLSIV